MSRGPHHEIALYATSVRASSLSERERAALSTFALAKRRIDYERGRQAAHVLLASRFQGQTVEVLPQESGERRGRPRAVVDGVVTQLGLSISHAGDCAVAAVGEGDIGIDLIEEEDHGAAFRDEVFREGERARFTTAFPKETAAAVDCIAFAAKEAALKALGVGFRRGLREIEICPLSTIDIEAMNLDEIKSVDLRDGVRISYDGIETTWVGGVWRLQTAFVVALLRTSETAGAPAKAKGTGDAL